jgi:Cof subfamily protein (haloacid dehalogenase superfamily)
MIKALFLDIDGTMVSFNTHVISPATCDALNKARQNGVKVFVASGRHLLAINNLGNQQFDGYVTLNGGLCYGAKGEVIYKRNIDPQEIKTILDYCDRHPLPLMFVREQAINLNFMREDVQLFTETLNFIGAPIADLHTLANEEIMQIIAFFTSEEEPEIMKRIPLCESARWSPIFSDVIPKGSNKSIGINKMIEYYGIRQDETMSFGDGGNDIPMLRYTGIGVAMGNALPNVQAEADYVTDSVDDEGIQKALIHFGII